MAIGVLKGIMAKGSKIKLGDKEYTIGKDLKALIQVGKTRGYEAVVEGYPISKIRRIKDKPVGWRGEQYRHSLSSQGIKSGRKKKIKKDYSFNWYAQPFKKLKKQDYHEIGTSRGLSGKTLKDYVKFMQKAFPNEKDTGYSSEWADRFRKGNEWYASDSIRRKVLLKIDKKYRGMA